MRLCCLQVCRSVGVLCAVTLLGGCSIIPSAGPNRQEISQATQGRGDAPSDLMLVPVDDSVVRILSHYAAPTLSGQFGDRRPPSQYVIGIGDGVTVTVWEAAQGGLFSPPASDGLGTGSQSASIPEQQVARDGSITVPFAGRVAVAGRTAERAEQLIRERLTGKAIDPQVLVVVTRTVNNAVTVLGEVNTAGVVPLSPKGERLLDVLALAGGNRAPVYDTFVTLSRRGRNVRVPLQTVVALPAENIYIQPGDTLSLMLDRQTFTAFGASGRNAQVPFEAASVTLEEAIAKSGGLIDSRADPYGVYLMRLEPLSIARMIDGNDLRPTMDGYVRVIYQLNMRDPNAILFARQIYIRNKDAIYIANAPLSDLNKVLSVFSTVAQPVSQAASIANGL